MKKTIIGSAFMLSGILISMSILITAVMIVPTVGSGNASRLLTAISVNELGSPFVIGIVFSFTGFVILIIEYFKKSI